LIDDDALRDQVVVPLLAGVRSPRLGHPPSILTSADRYNKKLRIDIEALFSDLGSPPPHRQFFADRRSASA